MVVAVPEHLSISQARLFDRCPKAFEFRYVTKLAVEPEPDEVRDFGRAVHDGLAGGYRVLAGAEGPLGPAERNVVREASVEALEEAWFREGLGVGESYDEAHEHVLAEWETDVFDLVPARWVVAAVEQKFYEAIHLPDNTHLKVTGIIDLMLASVGTGVLRLIDHKTGARLTSIDAIRNDDQLLLYAAVALHRHSDSTALLVGLNRTAYSGRDRLALVGIQPEQVAPLLAKLVRARRRIDAAAETQEFAARPSQRNCNFCDYKNVCPGALVLAEYTNT